MCAVHLSIAPQHVRPERVSTAFVLLNPVSTDLLGLCANKYVLIRWLSHDLETKEQ